MKKLGMLVMPLMAISFLASCGVKKLNRWYTYEDWWNYCSNGNPTSKAIKDDIGKEVNLTVNGKIHKVRLIGVDEDKNSKGKTIHTTFEFANLISDKNGYSLALQWNDTNDEDTCNHNYKTSTIHNALNGVNIKNALWAQKGGTVWSNDYTCSVLDMLNESNPDFVSTLKTPSKYININDGAGNWKEETITEDKLFLLSPKEMGYGYPLQEESTTTYSYYSGHDEQRDEIRIKKQINNENSVTTTKIAETTKKQYEYDVDNYAGYNNLNPSTKGSVYWLRSPLSGRLGGYDRPFAWEIGLNGTIGHTYVCDRAYPVAPAFCI